VLSAGRLMSSEQIVHRRCQLSHDAVGIGILHVVIFQLPGARSTAMAEAFGVSAIRSRN
jgi:hypothetical protein